METIDYAARVRAIKAAAAKRFGREVEVIFRSGIGTTHERFNTEGQFWYFRQGGRKGEGPHSADDPLLWRLDVKAAESFFPEEKGKRLSSNALFDLRKDYTEEAIERKFRALEIARDEYVALARGEELG
jgi:hypothetical protein